MFLVFQVLTIFFTQINLTLDMKNFILSDSQEIWENLLPLTYTRPISEIRIGILKIVEKWEKYLGQKVSYKTQEYLEKKYPEILGTEDIYISSHILPNPELAQAILDLPKNGILYNANARLTPEAIIAQSGKGEETISFKGEFRQLQFLPDIFALNGVEIQSDFRLITKDRESYPIEDKHTVLYNSENIFVEEGVKVKASILNAEKGVIYIGKNATISEGTVIQGNFALCEGATINPSGKMRGDTTIGNFCKVGGEVSNSVFLGYSNKGHDGFLGNSVIGEWCNLGADTNCSNLKNNYSNIKIWHCAKKQFFDTKRQFCGLLMADHSKAGINTMFNTGTVVGVNANVFGANFPPKFIPNFAWTDTKNTEVYRLDKAFEVAERMMPRRNKVLTEEDKEILTYIFDNYQTK